MDSNLLSGNNLRSTGEITTLDSRSRNQSFNDFVNNTVTWVRNCQGLKNIALSVLLSLLLAINQFLMYIRFSVFVNDVFFQLFLPAILTILVIYWAEELEDIVKVSFGSLLLFMFFFSVIIMIPWLLGYIKTGGTITLFYYLTTIIQIIPAIFVMVLLGATIAAIIKEIYT